MPTRHPAPNQHRDLAHGVRLGPPQLHEHVPGEERGQVEAEGGEADPGGGEGRGELTLGVGRIRALRGDGCFVLVLQRR
ncbi:hypothetical protein, partial [Streptomyces tateyamensis]|uniref:hypothetical protein n=1 Tax=Streptomyces tateyamensis TaxID=565073 RepID=UPI001C647BDC